MLRDCTSNRNNSNYRSCGKTVGEKHIVTDSRAALAALASCEVNSSLVLAGNTREQTHKVIPGEILQQGYKRTTQI